MTRFVRGQLPMQPADHAKLLKRGHQIFDAIHPRDAVPRLALARRGLPPLSTREWTAIKVNGRHSFVKGRQAAHSEHPQTDAALPGGVRRLHKKAV
jgi:hypothetical protein